MKKRIAGIVWILAFLLAGCGGERSFYTEAGLEPVTEAALEQAAFAGQKETEQDASLNQAEECYVYVCGEVHSPGVYVLPVGSRVYEAISMAGGLTQEAEESAINQALLLEDGQMIHVWAKGEVPQEMGASGVLNDAGEGRIDINSADMQELMEIPGIGEAKAKSILTYREEHGSFQSVEEVMNIAGIKEGLFSKMKDYIMVKE